MTASFSEDARASTFRWPIALSAVLICAVAVWLAFKISKGILTYPDELFTAERSREMLLLGRGSVHFNFHHTFAKPPLQYWLTSFFLSRVPEEFWIDYDSMTARMVPLLYGILTAGAVGWLAFLTDRKRPWLVPLSVAIYVSCPLYSTETVRAMLDTGLVFYVTLSMCFAQLARRDPRWWYVVAIACWLGALQKIPLIFLVWVVVVLIRAGNAEERRQIGIGHLIGSVVLALLLVSIWPLLQLWKFGMPLSKAFAGDDLETLFGQGHLGARPYFEVLDGLFVSGWAVGLLAIGAVIGFLTFRRLEAPAAIKELSILALAIIVLAIIFNFRSVRYVLPVVPWLSICLAYAIHRNWESAGKMRWIPVAVAFLVVLAGFAQATVKLHHQSRDASAEQYLAKALRGLQREGVPTYLVVPSEDKQALRSTGFYLFHGNMRSPLKRVTVDEFRATPRQPHTVGACRREDFVVVQSIYPEAKVQLATAGFVCWISDD